MSEEVRQLIRENRFSPARIFLKGLNRKFKLFLFPTEVGFEIAQKTEKGSYLSEYAKLDSEGNISWEKGFIPPLEDREWMKSVPKRIEEKETSIYIRESYVKSWTKTIPL